MRDISAEEIEEGFRSWKFKIQQTARGARVTVHGDTLEQTVQEYIALKKLLFAQGEVVAPEE